MVQPRSRARQLKEEAVARLSQRLSSCRGVILASFSGLAVSEMEELRRGLRQQGMELVVVKNRLARLAASGVMGPKLDEYFVGPTALALSHTDSAQAAKVVVELARSQPKLEVKAGFLDSQLLGPDQVKMLAALPPREVLLGQLLGQLKGPMASLVNVLSGQIRNLLYVLKAIGEKKEA